MAVVVPKTTVAMVAVAISFTSAVAITIVLLIASIVVATRGRTTAVATAIFVVAAFVGLLCRLLQLLLQRPSETLWSWMVWKYAVSVSRVSFSSTFLLSTYFAWSRR